VENMIFFCRTMLYSNTCPTLCTAEISIEHWPSSHWFHVYLCFWYRLFDHGRKWWTRYMIHWLVFLSCPSVRSVNMIT